MIFLKLISSAFFYFIFISISFADFEKGLTDYNNGNFKAALNEWLILAKQGESNSQYNVGLMYHKGTGTKQDFVEAMKWFEKSSEQGNIQAMQLLSTMLVLGRGTEINYLRSYIWASIAAENNDENSLLIVSGLRKEMTEKQLKKAKELTDECKKNNFKGC